MRNPYSHTLRSMMLLLLSSLAVAVNAVCPNGSLYSEGPWNVATDSVVLSSHPIKEVGTDVIEMVTECDQADGVYDKETQNDLDKDQVNHSQSQTSESSAVLKGPSSANAGESLSKTSDTVSNNLNEKFSWKGLILPGGLMAAGVIGMEAGLFKGEGDKDGEGKDNSDLDFEDVAQYVPAAAYLTLGFIPGIEHKHSFVERSMAAVTAYGMMFLVTRPVKHWIHERRPDWTSNDSFPSGHAAMAFTGAELMRLEYGTGIGLGAYALATTVSVLRICHNRHWFNDVVAGAGVGILCARASYWLLPFERKLFGIKNPNVAVAAFPICNLQSREFALGCCINF